MSILSKTAQAPIINNETREADDAALAHIEEIRAAMDADDYAKMRDHYAKAYGKATTLDDEAILLIVAASDDDKDPADWAKDMLAAEQTEQSENMVVSEAVSQDVMTVAHNLGHKLAVSKGFVPHMDELMKANELAKRGEAVIYLQLNNIFTQDDWDRIPTPGLKKGDLPEGSNEPYDLWSVKDHANDGKIVKYSFFTEMAKTIPYFQELQSELEDVSDVLKKEPELGTERRLEMRNKWTRTKQKAHKATLSTRKSRFMTTLKRSVAVKRQLDAINRMLGAGVVCQVLTDKQPNGELEAYKTTAPIEVSKKSERSICAPYTVMTFLKLDPAKALADSKGDPDAMFGALDATLTRAPKKPKDDGKGAASKYPPAENVDDLENIFSEVTAFLDIDDKSKRDNFLAVRRWFKTGTAEETEAKVRNFAKLRFGLDEIWNGGVRQVYAELEERDNKQVA